MTTLEQGGVARFALSVGEKELHVLKILKECPLGLTISEVADAMGYDGELTSIHKLKRRLLKKGLVELTEGTRREGIRGPKWIQRIELTDRGKEVTEFLGDL